MLDFLNYNLKMETKIFEAITSVLRRCLKVNPEDSSTSAINLDEDQDQALGSLLQFVKYHPND